MMNSALALLAVVVDVHLPNAFDETYRPQVHFTAPKGWINDPNGLHYKVGVDFGLRTMEIMEREAKGW